MKHMALTMASIFLMLGLAGGCAKRVLVQPVADMSRYNRLAVLPFETDSFLSTVGNQLADDIIVNLLEKAPNLNIVERARIDALMNEQNLVRRGYLSPESAIQVGRLLGVKAVITGSISISIGDIRPTALSARRVATGVATVRLIDTETGKVVWAKREKSEYSCYIGSDKESVTFSFRTDHEMVQQVIQKLGGLLAEAFYPHYELQY
jgi:TolB-like protein